MSEEHIKTICPSIFQTVCHVAGMLEPIPASRAIGKNTMNEWPVHCSRAIVKSFGGKIIIINIIIIIMKLLLFSHGGQKEGKSSQLQCNMRDNLDI